MPLGNPDFAVVGAAKAGTTLLWTWLRQHPDVFLPDVKEPNYFALRNRTSFCRGFELDPFYRAQFALNDDDYRRLYQTRRSHQISGEMSPSSLYFEEAAGALHDANPRMKIIVVFRNPVDRAFSQYKHHRRDGYEPLPTFEKALQAEDRRIRQGWWWGHHYKAAGYYAAQWLRYIRRFPERQLLPCTYEEMTANKDAFWLKLCKFLELAPDTSVDMSQRVNDSSRLTSIPANAALERMRRHGVLFKSIKKIAPRSFRASAKLQLERLNRAAPPVLLPSTREHLAEAYVASCSRLTELTGIRIDPSPQNKSIPHSQRTIGQSATIQPERLRYV